MRFTTRLSLKVIFYFDINLVIQDYIFVNPEKQ